MTISYVDLIAYIDTLSVGGTLSKADLNNIIRFILSGGLSTEINIQKSNNGGIF